MIFAGENSKSDLGYLSPFLRNKMPKKAKMVKDQKP